MARINIETRWWLDVRRKALIRLLGNEILADGAALHFWRTASRYWVPKKLGIPRQEFMTGVDYAEQLLLSGVAVEYDGMIYARGGKKSFDWLIERIENGRAGGQRSAKSRRSKINSLAEANAKQAEANAKPPYSLLLSPTQRVGGESMSKSPPAQVAEPPLPRLAKLWNDNAAGLAKVKKTNASRNRRAEQRYRELTEEEWIEVIRRIARSDFCQGRTGNRTWRATFDWLLQPDTALKVLEGKYDTGPSQQKKSSLCGIADV